VFPSYLRSEAFGVTLLEGAMCGKPLVSAEVGSGTSHINMDHKTGYVVTPGCPRSLRQALDRLHENPEQAEMMGRQARSRFEELFTGEIMGRRYAEVYRDVLSHAGQRGDFALGSHR
jgi:rhamnosyl/mannosyltransferase